MDFAQQRTLGWKPASDASPIEHSPSSMTAEDKAGSSGQQEDVPEQEMRDLYEILGVEKTADDDAIKKAYHKLALKCVLHPCGLVISSAFWTDKPTGSQAKFAEINAAFTLLSNADMRRRYDAEGFSQTAGAQSEHPP
eukprot:378026-Prorocentrum_minimum.AAC.4